jgi:hypothetical protein
MIDVQFNKFVTSRIVKIVWVAAVVLAVLALIGGEVYGFYGTQPTTVTEDGTEVNAGPRQPSYLLIILTPLAVALWVLFTRLYLELVIVLFKIADNTSVIALATRQEVRTHEPVNPYGLPGNPT